MTGGRYQRSLRACPYAYPELGFRPFTVMNGTGESDVPVVPGVYGEDIDYNATHIWKDSSYITNTTINGVTVSPLDVINDGDVGVLVFENVGTTGPKVWSVSTQEEWQENTQSGTNYEISTGELTLKKYWKVLWSDPTEYVIDGDTYTKVTTVGHVPKAIMYRWKTELMVEDKLWSPSAGVKLDLPTPIEFTTTSTSWVQEVSNTFTVNPSNTWIELRGDTTCLLPSPFGCLWWDSATGYTRNNIIEGYVYYTSGEWMSIVWNPRLSRPAQIKTFNVTTSVGTFEQVYVEVGVDTNGDGSIDHWTPQISLLSGFNSLSQYDLNLPEGYAWQVKFKLETTDSNDLSHAPTVLNYSMEVKSPEIGLRPNARAYDIQPFIDCLLDQRYIATEKGWSFFERLEGSNTNHRKYEALANSTQDKLGISYEGKHYPIGLVSFMVPGPDPYDKKLLNLLNTLGISVEEGQSSTDYYFLNYYFSDGTKVQGYRVWGVSKGKIGSSNLEAIPFFLDPATAREILGAQGACDLLYGYNCP